MTHSDKILYDFSMVRRLHPIIKNQIYHIFNRSVAKQPIFKTPNDYSRFINVSDFYRFSSPGLRYSFYNRLDAKNRLEFIERLRKDGQKAVSIFAFCLIDNHFHFLLRNLEENGIQSFARKIQDSYAKYINLKNKRTGALFQEMFKAVRIDSDEQFLHVARYIHLNPISSFVANTIEDLKNYPWSSLPGYIGKNKFDFVDNEFLNSFYLNEKELRKFTFDQADYLLKLKEKEYLFLE